MAHENATPRPWKIIRFGEEPAWDDGCCDIVWDEKEAVQLRVATGVTDDDAALIVEAVNAYDTLRAESERLREANATRAQLLADLQALEAEMATRVTEQQDRAEAAEARIFFFEAEARRYASMYPEGSDGRNTFVIFADMIAERAALSEAQP